MDFVGAWKASSIALTGAFGVIGLFREYKDKKTNKITKWGKVSLAGILVSTTLGIAAQLIESSNDAAKSLLLAQKSDRTLMDIERTLSPLDEPEISVDFDIKCEDQKYASFCRELQQKQQQSGNALVLNDWIDFPQGQQALLPLRLNIFSSPTDAKAYVNGKRIEPDWSVDIWSSNYGKDHSLSALCIPNSTEVQLDVVGYKPRGVSSKGRITSMVDLAAATGVITEPNNELSRLVLKSLEIKIKNGRSLVLKGPFEQTTFAGQTAFRFSFPKEFSSLEGARGD